MSQKPTPGAVRAARLITYVIDNCKSRFKSGQGDQFPDELELAAIIDRETTASELLKTFADLILYIDECEKLGQIQPMQAKAIREVAYTAIAKAEQTNPNPEV